MKRTYQSVLLLAFVLMTTAGAWANSCADYDKKMRWQSSLFLEQEYEMYAHEYFWPYVFSTGNNSALLINDISDPDHPSTVTSFDLPVTCSTLKYRDGTLFLGGRDGVMMAVDVSNPLQPVFRDSIHTGGQATQVFLAGDHVWAFTNHLGVSIVDISQPDNLMVLGTLPFEGYIYDMIECGGLAYIGTDDDWSIYDFSDPSSPELVDSFPYPALSFALEGETLLVGRQNEVATYDVSNPAAPVLVNSHEIDFVVPTLVIHDSLVSVVERNHADSDLFWLLDDGSFEWITHISPGYLLSDIFITDEHLYVCGWHFIDLINLADRERVTGGNIVDLPYAVSDMAMNGNTGFMPMGNFGLHVFDFEDPQTPVLIGSGFVPHSASAIVLQDNLAILAGSGGMSVLDVTDPTLPHYLGTTVYPNYYGSVEIALDQDTVWFAREMSSMFSIDISDPAHPEPGVTLSFRAVALEVSQGLLHTMSDDGTYRILSLDTTPPEEVASLQVDFSGSSIEVLDDLVLLGHGWYGLYFIDISDPENPVIINHIEVMGCAREVSVTGDYAVVSGYNLTQILDISDPLNVKKAGTIWDGGINHTVLDGGEIVLHQYDWYISSLQVYPAPCGILTPVPEIPLASDRHLLIQPNPFNPQTTISFNLPAAAPVTVRIYDLTGRLIKTLASGETMAAGRQSWTWFGRDSRGRDMSSGVYLVRLETGQFQATGRMVLVR